MIEFLIVWNGLTLADLVFPWFVWMMGASIVLSQRSLLKKKVSKLSILFKICRRTVILFVLGMRKKHHVFILSICVVGLILQGGDGKPKNLRILGVLQRLALCYFFAAILVLIFDKDESELQSSQWPIGRNKFKNLLKIYFFYLGNNVHQPAQNEFRKTVLQFWPQWLCIFFITLAWILITFVPKLSNCPRGYIGPGGKHEHGLYRNCTGGKVDILI